MIYRGQKSVRNKHGVKINRVRWELSPANLEPSSDRQTCETIQQEDEKRDESVIRCTSDDTSKYNHAKRQIQNITTFSNMSTF